MCLLWGWGETEVPAPLSGVGAVLRVHRRICVLGTSCRRSPPGPRHHHEHILLKKQHRDFPGGGVVENPPADAGDTGSIPRSGKIPHAAEQLSPCATTAEPVL